MPISKGLPSSLQQRGHCRAFCLLLQNLLQFPSGHTNAVTESFFATLECELLDRTSFTTHDQARAALFDFIEGFYNRRRRHSTNGYLSPHDHETRFNEYNNAA
jgi:transposase InsO family protein